MSDHHHRKLFAIIWSPGPAWKKGKPVQEQDLGAHRAYFEALANAGHILAAGPFLDQQAGGVALLLAESQDAASLVMANDPAVTSGVFVGELRPFHLVFGAFAGADENKIAAFTNATE